MMSADHPPDRYPSRVIDSGYSAARTAAAAGITYRQLDYWDRLGIMGPSICEARGSGSRRRYSRLDVRILVALAALTSMGAQIGQLSPVVALLARIPAWEGPLFVAPGGHRVGRSWSAVSGFPSAWVLDLGALDAQTSDALALTGATR